MTKPNFLIIGAPKCGTTALSEYLRSHPNIFMSTPKELNYFSDEFGNGVRHAKSLDEYLDCFKDCKGEHLAVGEASPGYLSSAVALDNIRKFNENMKIIVMLRNPVDLAYSLHSQLLFHFVENERDFEKAWKLQATRRAGNRIPKQCSAPSLLQYLNVCMLGEQVERVLEIFPAEQVKLILFDDFKTSTKMVYDDVLTFLEIPLDGKTSFPRFNVNKKRGAWRFGYLYESLRKTEPLNSIVTYVKGAFGIDRMGIRKIVTRKTVKNDRPSLNPAFRAELVHEFSADVNLLSRILDRDLSHWR